MAGDDMILKECDRGMIYMPEGDVKISVEVRFSKENITLYFEGFHFQDARIKARVDFYDVQQGLITTESEVLIKRNPAYPTSPYPWIGECKVIKCNETKQRQMDVRASVDIEWQFYHDDPKLGGDFFATIRNLSAGGVYIETVETLAPKELVRFRFKFNKKDRTFLLETVWGKKADEIHMGYGLRFINLQPGDEANIRNYVFRRLIENHRAGEE